MVKVTIYFDGGGQNPGPSACAAVAYDEAGGEIAQRRTFLGEATNNVAEYEGALLALRLAAEVVGLFSGDGQRAVAHVELVGDSLLIVRQLNGEWKVKDPKLGALYLKARSGLHFFDSHAVRWVPREENKRADALVREALADELGVPEKKRTDWKGLAQGPRHRG